MHTIRCKFIEKEKVFDQGYIITVKLIKGYNSQPIALAEKIQLTEGSYNVLAYLVEISKEEQTYLLFIDTSASKHKQLDIMQLTNSEFELEVSDNSIFTLNHKVRKMLLIMDDTSLIETAAILQLLAFNNINSELCLLTNTVQEDIIIFIERLIDSNIYYLNSIKTPVIDEIFERQTIGTALFIYGSWPIIDKIKNCAYKAGFENDVIQYKGYGQKIEKIFCVKCYCFNEKKNTEDIRCKRCNILLDVSTSYSKRLDAYLGYKKVD
ncbi:hypothetical protein [Peribacillus sp. SCS-155]|uniref:hypothetical protein n=1 Tax=Peribacillus sedimenti TaxID=3115297 RepID=UPI003905F55C